MSKVWLIAVREFVATVFTKAFIIGLLIFPAIMSVMVVVGPRLFGNADFSIKGQVAVIDPVGVVLPHLRTVLTQGRSEAAVTERTRATVTRPATDSRSSPRDRMRASTIASRNTPCTAISTRSS